MRNKLYQLRQSKLTRNYLYHMAYQLLAMFLPLITVPYISRVLGAENIGIYSYTVSIATYFISFGSLGMSLYGQREIAYHQSNKRRRTQIFYEIFYLRLITMTIALAAFFIAFVFKTNGYQFYFAILLLEILASALDISWFFQGLEEFKKIAIRNTIVKLLSVASIFLFVKSSTDLPIYLAIYVITTLLGNLSLWLSLPKYLVKSHFKKLQVWRHFKPTIRLFIPQIAIQVYTLLDKTMLGALIADKSEVGFYDQSQKIIKLLLTVITTLGTVMMPRIAATFAKREYTKIRHYLKKSAKFVFALSIPMILAVNVLADIFVPLFFGAGYQPVALLMKVISPILLLIGLSNVIGTQYLLPTKRLRAYTGSVVAGAAINFIINLALIPPLGALGASIGTVVAEAVVTSIQIFAIRHDKILRGQHHGKNS